MHAETEREMIACAAAHVVAIGIAILVRITVRGNDAKADACALGDRLAAHRHVLAGAAHDRSEEHTSELQSLMRISCAVFCLKKKKKYTLQIIFNSRNKKEHHRLTICKRKLKNT